MGRGLTEERYSTCLGVFPQRISLIYIFPPSAVILLLRWFYEDTIPRGIGDRGGTDLSDFWHLSGWELPRCYPPHDPMQMVG